MGGKLRNCTSERETERNDHRTQELELNLLYLIWALFDAEARNPCWVFGLFNISRNTNMCSFFSSLENCVFHLNHFSLF